MSDIDFMKISDLCINVISGGTPLRSHSEYYEDGTIPWLKTGDIKKNFIYEVEEFISEKGLKNSSAKLIPVNSVIVAMYGDGNTAGSVAVNKIKLATNQACCNLIVDSKKAHYLYIYYYLKGSYNNLVGLKLGGSQQNLNAKTVKDFPIRKFDLAVQKKIAAILSSYDDLIENNRRRIAILENMAEEIYREWFVRFRFPGYQNAEFEKGIPKGWEIVELNKIATENSKSVKAGNHLSNRFYMPLDIMGSKQFLPIDHYDYTEAQSSLVTFEKGEFVFGAMRPYQHKVVIAPFDGITRTTCFVIKPKEDYLYSYLYLTLFKKSTIDYAMLIANGSDRPYTVWNKGMEKMEVFKPSEQILKSFEMIARPILDSIVSYYFLQKKLNETRDSLLPRLISGKLSVENLDIQFPPSMIEDGAA